MVVQHNLTAMNANRYLGINNSKLSKSLEKLSSGYAINRAGDNAAGLAVSEKMRSQIAGMTQAVKNAQDGISMVQTFEGALTETDSILQRMKTLADQMANGTYDDPVDRTAAQQEFLQLNDELDQIADTDFNGVVALNGGVMADGTRANTKTGAIDYKPVAGADDNTEDTTITELGTEQTAKIGKINGFDPTKVEKTESVVYVWNGEGWGAGTEGYDVASNVNGGFVDKYGATISVDTTAMKKGDYVVVDYTANVGDVAAGTPTLAATGDATVVTTAGSVADDSFTLASQDDLTAAYEALEANNAGDGQKLVDALNSLDGKEITVTIGNSIKFDNANLSANANNVTNSNAGAIVAVGATSNYASGAEAAVDIYVVLKDGTTDLTAAGNAVKVGTFTTKYTSANNNDAATYTLNVAASATGDAAVAGTPGDATIGTATLTDEQKTAIVEQANKSAAGISSDSSSEAPVSIANKFGNSEAKMTYKSTIILQTGARTKDAVEFTFAYKSDAIGELKKNMDCSSREDGLNTRGLSLETQKDANYAIDKIDQAINKVSLVRGTFGAIQNRLEHKIDNLNVSVENLTSAESQIRDTNMPQEMMNFTKQQILAQASQSMLAQANQLPQGVLSLLQ